MFFFYGQGTVNKDGSITKNGYNFLLIELEVVTVLLLDEINPVWFSYTDEDGNPYKYLSREEFKKLLRKLRDSFRILKKGEKQGIEILEKKEKEDFKFLLERLKDIRLTTEEVFFCGLAAEEDYLPQKNYPRGMKLYPLEESPPFSKEFEKLVNSGKVLKTSRMLNLMCSHRVNTDKE